MMFRNLRKLLAISAGIALVWLIRAFITVDTVSPLVLIVILGLLLAVLGLPILGLLISVNVWGGYANRWGEVKYKEMLEGKPEDKKHEE